MKKQPIIDKYQLLHAINYKTQCSDLKNNPGILIAYPSFDRGKSDPHFDGHRRGALMGKFFFTYTKLIVIAKQGMLLFDLNGSLMPIHFFNYQFLSHAPISKASFRAIYQNVKIVLQTNQQNEMSKLQYLDDVDPLLTLISDICCMRRKYFCLLLQHFVCNQDTLDLNAIWNVPKHQCRVQAIIV